MKLNNERISKEVITLRDENKVLKQNYNKTAKEKTGLVTEVKKLKK